MLTTPPYLGHHIGPVAYITFMRFMTILTSESSLDIAAFIDAIFIDFDALYLEIHKTSRYKCIYGIS